MSRSLRVTMNPGAVSPSEAIAVAARFSPLLVLTGRSLSELAAELGGFDPAMAFLVRLAEREDRPIGVNFEHADGSSRTCFLAPRHWSEGRLKGWIGASAMRSRTHSARRRPLTWRIYDRA